jgi:ParB-like chromosome segregation protein Spo0J
VQPIRVRETDGGDYVVVAGHRRHDAAIDAALMEIPCVIVPAATRDQHEEAELSSRSTR